MTRKVAFREAGLIAFHTMEFKTEIDPGRNPPTPNHLALWISKHRNMLVKLAVKERTSASNSRGVNTIKLDYTGEFPNEDPDDLAKAVMQCAASHYHSEGREDDCGPKAYLVQAHQKDRNGGISRTQHNFTYNPSDEASVDFDPVDDGNSSKETVIEALLGVNDRLRTQIDQLFDKSIQIMERSDKLQQPLIAMTTYMGQVGLQGWHMQMQAMNALASNREAEMEHADRKEMREQMMGLAGPGIKTLMSQASQWFMMQRAKKMASEMGLDGERAEKFVRGLLNMDGPPEPAEPKAEPKAAEDPGSATNEEAKKMADDPHPVATMARMLGDVIPAKAWFAARDAMTKKEWTLLQNLLSVDTDDSAVSAYMAFAQGVKPEKLQAFHKELSDDAIALVGQFASMVQRHQEASAKASS